MYGLSSINSISSHIFFLRNTSRGANEDFQDCRGGKLFKEEDRGGWGGGGDGTEG